MACHGGHTPDRLTALTTEVHHGAAATVWTLTVLAATGSMVDAGTVLYRVDAEPVLALIGPLPAYRDLNSSSTDGVDIRQLEDTLAGLGYGAGLTVDEEFTDATAEAVGHWEEDLGRADPDGTVELGDVVFLPEPAEVVRHDAAVGDRVDAGSPVLTIAARTDIVLANVALVEATKWVPGSSVELRWPDGTAQRGTAPWPYRCPRCWPLRTAPSRCAVQACPADRPHSHRGLSTVLAPPCQNSLGEAPAT